LSVIIGEQGQKARALAAATCTAAQQLGLGREHGFNPPCTACRKMVLDRFGPPQAKPPGMTIVWPVDVEEQTQRVGFVPEGMTFFALWRDQQGTIHAYGSGETASEHPHFKDVVHLIVEVLDVAVTTKEVPDAPEG
jgi:hypothetical protein